MADVTVINNNVPGPKRYRVPLGSLNYKFEIITKDYPLAFLTSKRFLPLLGGFSAESAEAFAFGAFASVISTLATFRVSPAGSAGAFAFDGGTSVISMSATFNV